MTTPESILVVDDETGVRELTQALLTNQGYQVTTASNGFEAVDCLKKQSFDLVISDLMMAGMDGLQLLAELNSLDTDAEFILITAFGSIQTAIEAMRRGAADYIIKPFNNHEFLHAVSRTLIYSRIKKDKTRLLESLQEHNEKLTQMLEASNRLALANPHPDLILNEAIDIAQQQFGLNIAITFFDDNSQPPKTIAHPSFQKLWWGKLLIQSPPPAGLLRKNISSFGRISQTHIINDPHNLGLNAPKNQASSSNSDNGFVATALLLGTQGGRGIGILWALYPFPLPPVENIQRIEIFANQVGSALENSLLFANQLNQLRVRNTLVNAGQQIVTALNHKDVAYTVLDAAIRIFPFVDTAAIVYRSHLNAELTIIAQDRDGQLLPMPDPVKILVNETLASRQTIYKSHWQSSPVGREVSLVIEPLTLASLALGVLVVVSHRPAAFNEDHRQLLTMLGSQTAIALQNATLYAEAQRVDEIEALYEAGKTIDSTLNLQETLTTTMAVSRSLTGAAIGNVYLYSPDGERIDSVVTLGDDAALSNSDRRRSANLARMVMKRAQPELVIEPQTAASPSGQTIQSWLAVPLSSGDTPIGVLTLGSDLTDTFTANDSRLMQIVASHATSAIEKARLYEEVQQRLQQTEALNNISQSISTTLQLERVLELVVQSAVKTIPVATHSSLHLIDPKDGTIKPITRVLKPQISPPPELTPIQDAAVKQAVTQRTTIITSHNLGPQNDWSIMVAPLRVSEAVIGAIAVKSPRQNAFHPSEKTLLNTFASHASIAIQNANLFKDLSSAYSDLSAKQEEILRSHSTLQTLFDGITDGLYIVDDALRIVAINQAEANRLGTSPNTLIGHPCDASIWGRAAETVTGVIRQTLDSAREGIWDSQRDTDNRDLFTGRDVYTYPIFDPVGNARQVIIFAQDVSEKRRLQASLFRSANMAAVGQLATSVAHQINNPLTVIIANAQILCMDADPDSPDFSMFQHIEEAGTHIRKIVQNLLDFSTQESYEWFETNVEETINDALMLVTHSLRKSEITVTKNFADIPTVIASASHLKLLWMNLLLNARDAIVDANRAGHITITTSQPNPDSIQIELHDNGIGILAENRDRLFHPFFTTKSSSKNLGLGLFTCNAIVDQHQGQISLVAAPNAEGAVVSVTLPINIFSS